MAIRPPEPLTADHDVSRFDSGVPSLDAWLQRRAHANQVAGAPRTFVLCDDRDVIGYYALASGAIAPASTPGHFRRNMPDPIPVVLLARLAIARERQGQGLGNDLFKDAVRRAIHASSSIGVRGFVVRAISEDAARFYRAMGLAPSPTSPSLLMATLAGLRANWDD